MNRPQRRWHARLWLLLEPLILAGLLVALAARPPGTGSLQIDSAVDPGIDASTAEPPAPTEGHP